eukprot:CAMPEP_0197827002 /NCGR_PEP_ID=MMETSP1437-20131217/3885_1 /TAXON_ID=49252 ORGANISM="Eucampia antarctica, Strain CCMP1452" /NCGR_SAMPLE_ID=MMETSP1437 /ASSEMBLY_ACC=CAM_ASM_001096 /LENGTH=352 /DNA_ID=CAMNT_0043427691 /DNA_START=144 /DNA_END=1199 /DNA_ORIENTATION=-
MIFGSGKDAIDKGFNILETASKFVPQGRVVQTAKETWKFAWRRMMTELAPQDKTGAYSRPKYSFTNKIGENYNFPDEPGRFHLYVGNPCPWCHRAHLALSLRSITPDEIGMTVLIDDPVKASRGGWIFGAESGTRDPLGSRDLRELYEKLSPNFKGRCTAPLLVDLKQKKIVSNESSDIVRMLNDLSFGNNNKERLDLYPENLKSQIDESNQWVYELLNNGVYRCGFSTQQAAYDSASADVRRGLERCQDILTKQPFLCGSTFTESDLRLLPTILRFDGAYGPLFHAGGAHLRIRDYPAILAWLQRCWDLPLGVSDTIDIQDATSSYYRQLFPLNAGGLIPTPISEKDIGLN